MADKKAPRGAANQGFVADGFEPLAEAFESLQQDGLDDGASLAVYREGRAVLDLWGGVDPDDGTPWQQNSVTVGFSTTKAAATICLLRLVERGLVDLDAPVARYWPEFAAAGKSEITVSQVLRHLSALPYLEGPFEEFLEPGAAEARLAAQAPSYPPNTSFIYHPVTFGTMVGEIVRRVSGQSIGDFFAAEVAGPLGLEFWLGFPEQEDHRFLPSTYRDTPDFPEIPDSAWAQLPADTVAELRSMHMEPLPPSSAEADFNQRAFRAAQLAGASGVTNGRALARMFAALLTEVNGMRLLSAETVAQAGSLQTAGVHAPLLPDGNAQPDPRWGFGFHLDSPGQPMLGEGSFGHAGMGGRLGFAHPESGITFGYVSQRMNLDLSPEPDERMARLIEGLRGSL
ncbi:beta-lactamase family protein [Acaricomes phytoseiuli]|uniref:serine hydrolase domain-containing protein n=1 Tax=Acaricomes phytoseiuli TaxID=291968 RepID=UPI000368C414|nr:serine hydrolase domain-containing protein [Acaricomes phytoseiuli]MCW1248936.1 beta-lactamase family protein [Acaricomes phytoseiuli]